MRQVQEGNAQPEVLIVNLKNGNNVMRRPIKADSAIMHCKTHSLVHYSSHVTLWLLATLQTIGLSQE